MSSEKQTSIRGDTSTTEKDAPACIVDGQKVEVETFDPRALLEGKCIKFQPQDKSQEIVLDVKIARFLCSNTKSDGTIIEVSDVECMRFIHTCQSYKLDPLLNEIYFIKYDKVKPANFIVAYDIFLKRASSHPRYKGLQTGWMLQKIGVKSGDSRKHIKSGEDIAEDMMIIGAWCHALHEGIETPIEIATLKERNTGKSTWGSQPHTQLMKCAIAAACRRAFPDVLSKLYIDSEFPETTQRDKSETFDDAAKESGSVIEDSAGSEVIDVEPTETPEPAKESGPKRPVWMDD